MLLEAAEPDEEDVLCAERADPANPEENGGDHEAGGRVGRPQGVGS